MIPFGTIHDLVFLLPPMMIPAWWLLPAFGAIGLIMFELRVEARHR